MFNMRTGFWCILMLLFPFNCVAWDSNELELFDLVEEIQRNFYEVLGLDNVSQVK